METDHDQGVLVISFGKLSELQLIKSMMSKVTHLAFFFDLALFFFL
jgi:hypothetical protein